MKKFPEPGTSDTSFLSHKLMIHFSLFSGIGGFELAAQAMGWKNYLSCEINEFGNRVREYYWPDAYHHKNIKDLNYETIHAELSKRFGSEWRSEDIILTGGFPCQPFSAAGKQLGTEDDRHLWPEMLRVIGDVQPRWIVGENVRGLVNWGGGMVFDQVQADLEAKGYEILPFLLPACAKDATHRRDRVWFVGHSKSERGQKGLRERKETEQPTYGNSHKDFIELGSFRPTIASSFFGSGNDGLSERLDGITFSKWRNESIKAYGNAIVPQVAFEIFKAINACSGVFV